MSTKNIIISLVGVIFITAVIFFAMSKKSSDMSAVTPPPIQTTQENTSAVEYSQTPSQSATSDEIINYLVDGQSGDETKAAEASLETSAQIEAEPTINTNF